MPKKYLVGILGIIVALGLGAYWLYGRQQTDAPAIAMLPPAQALGFFAAPGLPQAWADLQQSRFFQHVSSPAFWQRALGPEGYRRLLAEKHQLEQHLGLPLTEQSIGLLLSREFGLALVPSPHKLVDVIAYVHVTGREKIVESLARTFSAAMQDLVRETQVVDDIEVVTLRTQEMPNNVSYAFIGTLAVLSTDPAWVIDAIKAHHGTAPARLHSMPFFQAMQLETSEPLLVYGYYDVEGIQSQAMAGTPWAAQLPPAASLQMLQTTGKVMLKAMRASNGIKVETMALYPPHGATQVFRQAEREGAMPPFRGVPAETFYLTHVDLFDLQGCWRWLRQFAALGAQDILQQTLAQVRAWAGVDLEGDVLPLFTGAVGLGITAPFGVQPGHAIPLPGVFLTFGITDEARGQQLIQRVGAHVGGPRFTEFLLRQPHDGHTIYYLGNPLLLVKPGYVISRQQLVLGSDVSLLQHMLDALTGKTQALSDTNAYQDMRKHFRTKGGSITFIDVTTAVEKIQDAWLRFGGLLQALTPTVGAAPSVGSMAGDPWVFLEMLRPVRYIGAASQAETQGVRTEVFVVLEDLQ
jgi:Protein of unknown function (DUF3352)